MGQLCSTSDYSPDGVGERNPKKKPDVVRFFMAGMGSAGKSTIIRHLKFLCTKDSSYKYCNEDWTEANPNDSDAETWRATIRQSIINALKFFIDEAETKNLKLASEELQEFATAIEHYAENPNDLKTMEMDDAFTTQLLALIEDPAIVETKKIKNKVGTNSVVFDGLDYFLVPEKLKDVFSTDYVPSEPDCVHGRFPTVGVQRFYFMMNKICIEIYDAGGQVTERKKMLDYLTVWNSKDISSRNFILFVTSIADYNIQHPKLPEFTLLDEAAVFMDSLLNSDHTKHCGLLIFFNKTDRFFEKLADPDCRENISYLEKSLPPAVVAKYKETGEFKKEVMIAAATTPFVDCLKQKHTKINSYSKDTCAVDPYILKTFYNVIKTEILTEKMATILP